MSKLQDIANMATVIAEGTSSETSTAPQQEYSSAQPVKTANVSAGITDHTQAQLEAITTDIRNIIKKQIIEETKPFFIAVHTATIELRQLTELKRSNTSGLKHYLRIALVACIAGTASFFLLKYQLGLGEDADYGRRARAVIQQLDSQNRAILEQLIERK